MVIGYFCLYFHGKSNFIGKKSKLAEEKKETDADALAQLCPRE